MQTLKVVYDQEQVSEEQVRVKEEAVWKKLKLSGEYNRTRKQGDWVILYITEQKIKEESFSKIEELNEAKEVVLKDTAELAEQTVTPYQGAD